MVALDPIMQALRAAARLCRTVQHQAMRGMEKDTGTGQEPVTIADYGSQAILGRMLAAHYPDDTVIAEESGYQFQELLTPEQSIQIINLLTTILDQNITHDHAITWLDQGQQDHMESTPPGRTWVIDPIDGTKGFIAMRHYAIGLGILTDGKPTGAFMVCPGYGDGVSGYDDDGAIFYVQDETAYMTGIEADAIPRRIQVSTRTNPAQMRVVQSFEPSHVSKERIAKVLTGAGLSADSIRELDSMEKYALVACGDADVFLRIPRPGSTRPHKAWDHAAGAALVEAAGGRVTDLDGKPLDFSQGMHLPNRGMIVSNGVIHDALVASVTRLLEDEAE